MAERRLALPAGEMGPEQQRGTAELTGQWADQTTVWPRFLRPGGGNHSAGPGPDPRRTHASMPLAPTLFTRSQGDLLPRHRRD